MVGLRRGLRQAKTDHHREPPRRPHRRRATDQARGNRMRTLPGLALVLVFALLGMPAVAQPQSASPASALLAAGRLASVIELPLFLRLYRARLPAAQHASYQGSSAMLYDL